MSRTCAPPTLPVPGEPDVLLDLARRLLGLPGRDLTLRQLAVLLLTGKPITIKEIRAQMGLDISSPITRAADLLIGLGMLERRHNDAGDRRTVTLWRTAEGDSVVASLVGPR